LSLADGADVDMRSCGVGTRTSRRENVAITVSMHTALMSWMSGRTDTSGDRWRSRWLKTVTCTRTWTHLSTT